MAIFSTPVSDNAEIAKTWKDHVDAHNSLDVEAMANTYSSECYITWYNLATKERQVFHGREGSLRFARQHLDSLKMKDGTLTKDMQVKNNFYGNTLYNIWDITSSSFSYKDGADTFQFGGPGMKITHHYQYYYGTPLKEKYNSREECWAKHGEFFANQNIIGLVNTYTEDCFISVFNFKSGSHHEFRGLAGAAEYFTKLFEATKEAEWFMEKNADNPSDNQGGLILAWKVPSVGVTKGSDTFFYSEKKTDGNKIQTMWTCLDGPDFLSE